MDIDEQHDDQDRHQEHTEVTDIRSDLLHHNQNIPHESIDQEQQQQLLQRSNSQYRHIHINEAIALESMIDSDVYGKLKDIFPDNDLKVIDSNQSILPQSNSSSSVIDPFRNQLQHQHSKQHEQSIERPYPYAGLEFMISPTVKPDTFQAPSEFQSIEVTPELPHHGEQDQLYKSHPTHSPQKMGNLTDSSLSLPIMSGPTHLQQDQQHDESSIDQFNENSPSPPRITSSSRYLASRTNSMPEIKTLNIDSNPSLKPDESPFDDIPESSTSPINMPSSDTGTSISNKRRKYKPPKGGICHICEKVIKRDISRHLRTHEEVGRFKCIYPRKYCIHRTGFFNRQYDYKKHLLHLHFKFEEEAARKLHNLNEKLRFKGTCACGEEFTAGDWLNDHILTSDHDKLCPSLKKQLAEEEDEDELNE